MVRLSIFYKISLVAAGYRNKSVLDRQIPEYGGRVLRILDADFIRGSIRLCAVYADVAAHGDDAVGGLCAAQIGQYRLQRVALGDPAEIQLQLRIVLGHCRAVHVDVRDPCVPQCFRNCRRRGNRTAAVYVP